MATPPPQYLYLLNEDLYRLGNQSSPKLHNVRSDDVQTYERNGILMLPLREDKNDMTTNAPPTTTVTLTLSRKATRYVLEALQMLESKWLEINHTSTDEDEQADYGNDALDLHGTRESIQSQAVEAFGSDVTNFSREPFPASATPNGERPGPR